MGGESTPRLATTPRCRSVRLRISSVCHERGTMSKNPRYPAAAVPYLMIRGAAQGIDFYKKAFGAEETMRFPAPGGTIGHAEIRVEGAPVFLADEGPGVGLRSEEHTSELQSRLHLVCRLLLEKKKKTHSLLSRSQCQTDIDERDDARGVAQS